MQIFVTTFNHRFPLDVCGDDSRRGVKVLIWHQTGIPPKEQQLSFNREILEGHNRKLKDYGIGDGATLRLVDLGDSADHVAADTIPLGKRKQ